MRTILLILAMPLAVASAGQSVEVLTESVVRIGGCSGVIIEDAYVLTAQHCGPEESVTVILSDGRKVPATLVDPGVPGDSVDDPVFYRIDPALNIPHVKLATSGPQVGDRVSSIGYPRGRWASNRGVVIENSFDTEDAGGFEVNLKAAIITDWPSVPGNSGGPLFNEDGDVVGLLSMSDLQTVSIWIPLSAVTESLKAIQKPGQFKRIDVEVPRPEVVIFSTPGCGPCEELKRAVKEGRFPDYRFTFNIYSDGKWSDPALAREFAELSGAPARLGFPVVWPRGSKEYKVGYATSGGLLGWLRDTVKAVVEAIVGKKPSAPIFPVPDTDLGNEELPKTEAPQVEPPKDNKAEAAISEAMEQVRKLKEDVAKLKSANPVKKSSGLLALKKDVAKMKASATALKEDTTTNPLSYLAGIFGLLIGCLHRKIEG